MQTSEIATLVGAGAASISALAATGTFLRVRTGLREQLRPMVTAELQKHPYGKWVQEIVIRNHGQTPARSLHVRFDPILTDPDPSTEHATTLAAALVRRFAKEIEVVPPSGELRQIYYSGEPRPGSELTTNTEDLPDVINVEVQYCGPGRRRAYVDRFRLDIHLIGLSTTVGSKDNPASQRRVIADGVAKLAKISNWP